MVPRLPGYSGTPCLLEGAHRHPKSSVDTGQRTGGRIRVQRVRPALCPEGEQPLVRHSPGETGGGRGPRGRGTPQVTGRELLCALGKAPHLAGPRFPHLGNGAPVRASGSVDGECVWEQPAGGSVSPARRQRKEMGPCAPLTGASEDSGCLAGVGCVPAGHREAAGAARGARGPSPDTGCSERQRPGARRHPQLVTGETGRRPTSEPPHGGSHQGRGGRVRSRSPKRPAGTEGVAFAT